MTLIRSESGEKTMEENSPVVAMPVISIIERDVTCSVKCLSEEANELDNGLTVIREKKSVFLTDYAPLWGCSSVCGLRPEMEDVFVAVPRFFNVPIWMLTQDYPIDGLDESSKFTVPAHFFGVYDGHGGAQVASYCRDRIHQALTEELNDAQKGHPREKINFDLRKEWDRAFIDCFKKVDDETEEIVPETVGSTAVVAVVSSSHIIVANCGDSRAVLSRGKQAMPLSVDHKPEREEEYARIEAEGGKVIWWNGYRVLGVLAMSRSIGDRYLKPWIIPVPETTIIPRAKDDDCLVLASDGLWDVVSNQEACDLARRKIMAWHKKNGTVASSENLESDCDRAAQFAADSLSRLALQKGSKDNITVLVVDLRSKWKFKSKS